jgi:glycosyltransferase involved in cell wall biosynthesis
MTLQQGEAPGPHPECGPLVSVLLPVCDGERSVGAAVDSVLAQSYRNIELLVLDDGSRDGTPRVVAERRDPRVRVFRHENMGLAPTLNRGLEVAAGRYVARQDADDLSLPGRFARQVDFLERHPRCALLGTGADIWVGDRPSRRRHRHPARNGEAQARLLYGCCFVHSSVMFRRAAIAEVGPYPTAPERQPPEDYDLWSRIAARHEIANLPETLVIYRELPGSISRTRAERLRENGVGLVVENLAAVCGDVVERRTLWDLAAVFHGSGRPRSDAPDWTAMRAAVDAAGRSVARRFPDEADAVERGIAEMRRLLRLARLRHSPRWAALYRASAPARWLVRRLG